MTKMKQLLQLIGVQFLEFMREPAALFWTFVFPIAMSWGLGVAFSSQGEQVRHVAWVEQSPGRALDALQLGSDSMQVRLGSDRLGTTVYKFRKTSWEEAMKLIKRGNVALVLTQEGDSVTYHFDPKNPDAQAAYLQLSAALSRTTSATANDRIEPFSEIGTRYIDFLLPGLIGMNIMMSCMWGVSYSLIDRRSKKLLRRMVATPMSKPVFLLSHFIVRLLLSIVETVVVIAFAKAYFDIRIEGSIGALFALLVTGNLIFFGIAVLISSRTANPQVGNGMINAVVMPMMICSGVFFSYQNFPEWMMPVLRNLPLSILADNLRSVFIEGAGFMQVLLPAGILTGAGLTCFFIGYRIYKWY